MLKTIIMLALCALIVPADADSGRRRSGLGKTDSRRIEPAKREKYCKNIFYRQAVPVVLPEAYDWVPVGVRSFASYQPELLEFSLAHIDALPLPAFTRNNLHQFQLEAREFLPQFENEMERVAAGLRHQITQVREGSEDDDSVTLERLVPSLWHAYWSIAFTDSERFDQKRPWWSQLNVNDCQERKSRILSGNLADSDVREFLGILHKLRSTLEMMVLSLTLPGVNRFGVRLQDLADAFPGRFIGPIPEELRRKEIDIY